MTTTSSSTNQEHQSDDNYPARLLEAHPRLGDAIERVAHQAETAIPAPRKQIRNPDQALLSAAMAGDLPKLKEALRAGADPSAIETSSRSIGMHGRYPGPYRSALQLALLSRSKKTWVDCAHELILAGADHQYINRWGESAETLLRERLARARMPERNYRLFGDYLLNKILRAKSIKHWFDDASRTIISRARGERA